MTWKNARFEAENARDEPGTSCNTRNKGVVVVIRLLEAVSKGLRSQPEQTLTGQKGTF